MLAPTLCSRDTEVVTTTSLLASILQWLRAGYPEGVPGPDRVPLLALLRTTPLTEEQIKDVVRHITTGGSGEAIDHSEIAAFIADVTNRNASEEDIRRVACRLASGGWPLAGMNGTSL